MFKLRKCVMLRKLLELFVFVGSNIFLKKKTVTG